MFVSVAFASSCARSSRPPIYAGRITARFEPRSIMGGLAFSRRTTRSCALTIRFEAIFVFSPVAIAIRAEASARAENLARRAAQISERRCRPRSPSRADHPDWWPARGHIELELFALLKRERKGEKRVVKK
ncbi:uncharacterized protein TrAFT101_011982 [Trichoderma asperellum]|uniref:uncharacterized protein n=1 Tax=Trichoderma asperellum TaxID=101201 RepID=UPI00332EAFF4|nr:hypothetical protein TrAFT101_011982 [Trichoderma asperellum]